MTSDPMPKGFTYFISDGDMIKIGSSMRPHDRISALQTGSARDLETLAIVPIDIADEFQTHQKFAHLRGAGNGFRRRPNCSSSLRSWHQPRSAADAAKGSNRQRSLEARSMLWIVLCGGRLTRPSACNAKFGWPWSVRARRPSSRLARTCSWASSRASAFKPSRPDSQTKGAAK